MNDVLKKFLFISTIKISSQKTLSLFKTTIFLYRRKLFHATMTISSHRSLRNEQQTFFRLNVIINAKSTSSIKRKIVQFKIIIVSSFKSHDISE